MADETTQTEEETWWDLDIFADSELPSTSLDEPLEWPETLDWGESSAADGDLQFPGTDDADSAPIFPPTSVPDSPAPAATSRQEPANGADAQWRANGDGGNATMAHVTVLSGLGGGATRAPAARAGEDMPLERLPDSLWAGGADAGDGRGDMAPPLVTTTIAAPTFHTGRDSGAGGWRRRFDIRHGNAAVIALISFVSLILLGMFMSVRARNQLPDTSQTRTTTDQIQVQGTLNTVPLTIPTTTIPAPINIADLVPPAEDATAPAAGAVAGSGSGGSAGTSPATTAAPVRSTPAAGGGGATGTTQPAAQPTNTTAAPQTTAPPETTTPTSPPVNQTTTPTVPRRTTPTFPSITSTVPDSDTPTMPSFPNFPSIPGFGN